MIFYEGSHEVKFLFYLNKEKEFIDSVYFFKLGDFNIELLLILQSYINIYFNDI